jgi:hypothetical protein
MTPLAYVMIGRRLYAVFNFADTRIVLTGRRRQFSTGQTCVFT